MKQSARSLALFLLLVATVLGLSAQELNCTVEVNSDQVQNTGSKQVFETLQASLNDYMNTTKFTNAQFAANEKIECRVFITVKEYDGEKISGDLQVQSTRPVYNSNYNSTVLNFKDTKIEFTYQENEPLIFSENNMESNLTAIMNFYAYLIIALDFDTFSPRGGDPYWERVDAIVRMAQSSGETGWKQFEDNKNRAAVLSAYTDPSTSSLRDLLYNYHRKGLDEMSVSPDKGRAAITESLEPLRKVFQVSPMSVGLSMFKDAKLDELVNVYTKGTTDERESVYELLYSLYPTEQSRLDMIKRGVNR
ncbi:MAG: DUF4835 family protein [Muribaculaceae bacterium]|nr:DUF4835 family protein [Muribaculaceae bacterium]